MGTFAFIFAVVAGALGAIEVLQTGFRSLVGWAVVALTVAVVLGLAYHTGNTVNFN